MSLEETNNFTIESEFLIKEQTKLLYLQAPISNATVLGVGLLFYYFVSYHVESVLSIICLIALCFSASLRLFLWYLYKSKPDLVTEQRWLQYYLFASALVGISWSLLYPLISIANDLTLTVGLFMLIFGIIGSAVIVLSINLTAFYLYVYPQVFTFFITLLSFQETSYNLLAIGVIAYVLMTILFTKNVNRNIIRRITLEYQNTLLINKLNNESSEREQLIQQRTMELKDKNSELTKEINERQEIELALRKSKNEYKELINDLPDVIYRTDNNGVIVFVSPSFEKITGYAIDDVVNKLKIEELYVSPEDRVLLIEEISNKGFVENFEVKLKRHDDTILWGSTNSHFYKDKNGNTLGIEGVVRDITEPKLLRENMQKLAQAVEQSVESIVITNVEGEIEYVNKAFTDTTGYSQDDVIGKYPSILKSGKTPDKTYSEMWDVLISGNNWEGEFTNLRKNGSEYIELAHVSPLSQDDGEVTHYVAVKEDITEKKHLAKELDKYRDNLEHLVDERTIQLAEAQKLAESANQAKSEFLANMSHEIRTPMNAIIGMSHLALQTDLDGKQKNFIEKVHASANGLLNIINDILDFSKVEAGKLELEETNFQLKNVIKNTLNLLKFKAEEKAIELSIKIESNVPKLLNGDPLRVGQVLTNITNNAIKFSHSGETITINVLLCEESEQKVTLQFSVKDTGIGISSKHQEKLFRSFSQVDNSTSRKYGGTGLGLKISEKIIRLMNGSIWVESEEKVGSTFFFKVILNKHQEAQESNNNENSEKMTNSQILLKLYKAKILLVEDNAINQELAKELLEMNGMLIETADNGSEALKLLEHQTYDAILMDCQMPVMDGYEATRQIRSQKKYKDLPILAMTANVMKGDKEKVLLAGMNDHIAKPINITTMLSTMAKWIDSKNDKFKPPPEPESKQESEQVKNDNSSATTSTAVQSSLYGIWPELSTLRNKPKLNQKYLIRFRDKQINFEQRFRSVLLDGDYDVARTEAHTLKGLAGTLGMKELQKLAFELEVSCRDRNDNIEELLLKLLPELEQILEGLNSHEIL